MREKNKVAFHSLGCKVNSYETDAMMQLFAGHGYEIVPFEAGADIYIINTCTVTNIADRKSRQMLHKARKMNPDAIVVATGCYAQVVCDEEKNNDMADIIVGNNKKKEIVNIIESYTGKERIIAHFDINNNDIKYETLNISRTAEHTRAYIKIQDGCNQFCSYCLIPYARGRVRSRRMADVIEEVNKLSQNGYKEIVLTGIHISSYGTDFEGQNINLYTLLKELNNVAGIERIRLGSIEPKIMTEQFVREISKLSKICPHFHLSLQSGCQNTLKSMNRHYTPDEYMDSCNYIKKYFEHPAITTDVIVGFPGETDNDFEESYNFVKSIQFFETHIFKYSKREGTRAALMENQIDERVKTERSNRMISLGKKQMHKFMEYYIGKEVEILFEETYEYNGKIYQVGHTREYVKAAYLTSEDLSNRIIKGNVTKFLNDGIILLKND